MSPPETQRPAPAARQGRAASDAVSESARHSHSTAAASTPPCGPRRVTVAAHQRFRESLCGGPVFDPDDDLGDLAEILDRPPACRKERDARRVLELLDGLDCGEEVAP